jgi:hypothetical protein
MKIVPFLFCIILCQHVSAEEWQLGPIRIGQSLAVIEQVLGVKADDVQCAVISLSADKPGFPFFAAGFKWIEVAFPNVKENAKVGSIGLGIPAERILTVESMLVAVLGKGKRDGAEHVWLRNKVRYRLSPIREMLMVETLTFRCLRSS